VGMGLYTWSLSIALHGEGSEQRMAVVDRSHRRVYILNVESGERVATVVVGSEGEGADEPEFLFGLAFSSTGELYVSDHEFDRIFVFDREGRYVRGFGEHGRGEGQFAGIRRLCFTVDGNLVVADAGNHRVQIVREDGTFVRSFGSEGREDGEFHLPSDVSVGPDGSIAVLDGCGRVQIFDGEGRFVRRIGSVDHGPGKYTRGVAHGAGGEIIVADFARNDVQVFSGEGELLQIIGAKGDSKVALHGTPYTVAADGVGRIFVIIELCGDDEDEEEEEEEESPRFEIVLLSSA
jgi:tripartite motif-containing protein 71